MKKILALVLTLMLVLGMTAALAKTASYTNGSIVVNNAVKGESYYAIKVLGATVSDDGIAYTGDIPSQLESVLEVKTVGTAPNQYQAIGQKDNVSTEDYATALRAYANAQQANWGTAVPCNGNSVTFTNLEPGFYVIVSTLTTGDQTTLTNKVSAGSTYNPNAAEDARNVGQVFEKNTTTVTLTKSTEEPYSIGDTITYTVTFNGANYRGEGANAQIVTKYVVTDTLPEFLSNVTVTGITIGSGEGSVKTVNEENFPGVTTFGTNKTFDIPWAQGSHADGFTSLYPNGTQVTITYTAVLTDIVKVGGTTGNKNVVTLKPWVDKPDGPGPHEDEWHDDAKVFTYAAALKKTDGTTLLAGAKFKFTGLTATQVSDGVYRVTAYNPTSITYENSTELEVGSNGKLYILGLKQTTDTAIALTGYETVAPDGYNKLTSAVTLTPERTSVEIWASSGHRWYDEYDNLVASESSTMHSVQHDKDVTENLSVLDEHGVEVINQAGTQLPSTGGVGTTIFYVVGGILVLGAVIFLVTKRRMGSND